MNLNTVIMYIYIYRTDDRNVYCYTQEYSKKDLRVKEGKEAWSGVGEWCQWEWHYAGAVLGVAPSPSLVSINTIHYKFTITSSTISFPACSFSTSTTPLLHDNIQALCHRSLYVRESVTLIFS